LVDMVPPGNPRAAEVMGGGTWCQRWEKSNRRQATGNLSAPRARRGAAAALLVLSSRPMDPITLGPFTLLRRIAIGRMAEVYLARREGPRGFEKLVALKCIHRHLCDDPDFVSMFLDEARIAGCLSHPCIAEIHELGEGRERPYLAEEFVFGRDLRA